MHRLSADLQTGNRR